MEEKAVVGVESAKKGDAFASPFFLWPRIGFFAPAAAVAPAMAAARRKGLYGRVWRHIRLRPVRSRNVAPAVARRGWVRRFGRRAALLGIRASDAHLAPSPGTDQVGEDGGGNGQHNGDDDEILHALPPVSAYSARIFFPLCRIIRVTVVIKHSTTASPPMAAATFSEAGAVKSVPMVYTRYPTV